MTVTAKLKNYTTSVPATRTISEIEAKLAEFGATDILKSYTNGYATALCFKIETPRGLTAYRMPIDVEKTQAVLKRGHASRREIAATSVDQAYRVAWRIIKDWMEAQLSLIETEMVRFDQVFMPYIIMGSGKTLAEAVDSGLLQLGAGGTV